MMTISRGRKCKVIGMWMIISTVWNIAKRDRGPKEYGCHLGVIRPLSSKKSTIYKNMIKITKVRPVCKATRYIATLLGPSTHQKESTLIISQSRLRPKKVNKLIISQSRLRPKRVNKINNKSIKTKAKKGQQNK